MQTISGIHYNFSRARGDDVCDRRGTGGARADADFATEAYFGLIRNFRRYSWLLIYLFGASPAVCKSFVRHADAGLDVYDEG